MRVKALYSFVGVYGSVKPGQILEVTDSANLEHYLRLGLVQPAPPKQSGVVESNDDKPGETPSLELESHSVKLETPAEGPEGTGAAIPRKRAGTTKPPVG